MKRLTPLLLAASFAAVALLASVPARAAPPGLPTLEEVYQRALKAKAAAKAAAEAAKKNPILERINRYRDGITPLKAYDYLTEILQDSKDPKTSAYRMAAAEALVERFREEGTNDALKRKVRREIGLELVSLMKAHTNDKIGLRAVHMIFKAWWGKQVGEYNFEPGGKYRDRAKAFREMKAYLNRRGS